MVEVSKVVEEPGEQQQQVHIQRTKAEMAFQKMKEKTVSIITWSSNSFTYYLNYLKHVDCNVKD